MIKNKKGDMPMWLVGLIITLLILLIIMVIIANTGKFQNGFLDFLRGWS
ncbi:hypothetical protein JXB31_02460 [Candidatus Woesearchaeota archaeon]|nr:hypothetical protein [Candidatus Woesearchaeota archaeon]